jgi:TPP-dependent pyruvate/acetoin dehydrogenase alpha subunit
MITEETIDAIHQEITKEIDAAVDFAEKSPEPKIEDVMEWVYA